MESKTYIEKPIVNNIRSRLKTTIRKLNEIVVNFQKRDYELTFGYKKDADEIIALCNKNFGTNLAADTSIIDIQRVLRKYCADIRYSIEVHELFIKHMTQRGFNGPTRDFPYFISIFSNNAIELTFLSLSGIRANGLLKEDGYGEGLERELVELEREMAKFITDYNDVELESLEEFVKLYSEYLCLYLEKSDFFLVNKINADRTIEMALQSLGRFEIYLYRGEDFTKKEHDEFLEKMAELDFREDDFAHKFYSLCEDLIGSLAVADEEVEIPEEKTEVITPAKEISAAYQYIENNRVVRVCDIDAFENMLDETELPYERKREYLAQMRNLINRRAQEELARRVAECQKKYFGKEEEKLYLEAKRNADCRSIVDDIDAIVLMFLDETDEENLEILKEELTSAFESLKELYGDMGESTTEKIPNLLYFTRKMRSSDGKEVSVPQIYTTISWCDSEDYKFIHTSVKRLISGNIGGDNPVKGVKLPCHVWYKGRDVKVFYTKINDTIMIIDVAKGEGAFKEIPGIVNRSEFKRQLDEAKAMIQRGEKPDARVYTKLLMKELEKAPSVKKSNQ